MGCMSYINEKTYTRILAKKLRLEQHRPLSEGIVEKLRDNMEIAYTYNTNAIEGNTLSLGETRMIIREGLTVRGKSLIEHLEAKNHPQAITYIENIINNQLEEPNIREIHNILFSGLCENPGNYRNTQVYIEGTDYCPPPAFEVPRLVEELVDWLNGNPEELRPIELAAVFHHKLVAIHPFDDGNGRVGRLLMNLLLIQKGYPLTVIKTVDKQKYYDCLHKADADNLKAAGKFCSPLRGTVTGPLLAGSRAHQKRQPTPKPLRSSQIYPLQPRILKPTCAPRKNRRGKNRKKLANNTKRTQRIPIRTTKKETKQQKIECQLPLL